MVSYLFILLFRWGYFSLPPMKSLLLLEFLYLVLVYVLVECGLGGWWIMLIILFSACEGVFLLTVYIILGVGIKSRLVKFFV